MMASPSHLVDVAAIAMWNLSSGEATDEPMKVMMQHDVLSVRTWTQPGVVVRRSPDSQCLQPLLTCLHDVDPVVVQRTLGCLSNLALFDAGLLTHKHCVPACAALLHKSTDVDVQTEAAAVLWNLVARSKKAAEELLARDQAVAVVCQHLINTPHDQLRRCCLGIVANMNNLPGASATVMAEGVGPACVRFCSVENDKEIR